MASDSEGDPHDGLPNRRPRYIPALRPGFRGGGQGNPRRGSRGPPGTFMRSRREIPLMHKTSEMRYATRCAFQNDLDRAFPHGAVCALLPVEGHRVQTRVGRVESTGRLFCSDIRPSPGAGGWDYEILIDAGGGRGETAEELRVWIGALTMHSTARGLWEAPVRSDHGEMLLRLTPGAADGGAAGPALRKAVTIAHEHELFPEGILA